MDAIKRELQILLLISEERKREREREREITREKHKISTPFPRRSYIHKLMII